MTNSCSSCWMETSVAVWLFNVHHFMSLQCFLYVSCPPSVFLFSWRLWSSRTLNTRRSSACLKSAAAQRTSASESSARKCKSPCQLFSLVSPPMVCRGSVVSCVLITVSLYCAALIYTRKGLCTNVVYLFAFRQLKGVNTLRRPERHHRPPVRAHSCSPKLTPAASQ